MTKYVHGYSTREAKRLKDQANTLDEILHHDTVFPPDNIVLEAGCGVGAQTKIIAPKNSRTNFISIDLSENSIHEANKLIKSLDIDNVTFQQADIYKLPFEEETFDYVFVCFVLEHLHDPIKAIYELKRVLKNEGKIILIEGDHGSAFFYPDSMEAHLAIDCQIKLQKSIGGNSNIGRELYPLLLRTGFCNVSVSPRMVYIDASKSMLVEGFIRNTFTAMIEGIGDNAVQQGLIDQNTFQKGIKGLYRTTEPDGVFSYTFFKGTAIKRKE
jgi:hypothetical protein